MGVKDLQARVSPAPCKSTEVCGNGIIEARSGGPSGPIIITLIASRRLRENQIHHVFAGRHARQGYLLSFVQRKLARRGLLWRHRLAGILFPERRLGNVSPSPVTPCGPRRYEYGDFGAPQFLTSDGSTTTATTSAYGNPYLFHGMEWDPETGLYCAKGGENPLFEGGGFTTNPLFDPNEGRYLMRAGVPLGLDGTLTVSLAKTRGAPPLPAERPALHSDPSTTYFLSERHFSRPVER